MIKIKCPVCGGDSFYKSSSFAILRLRAGEVVALQCGDEVRLIGQISRQEEPEAPYIELEVFAVGRE